jgi:hypothetical protein
MYVYLAYYQVIFVATIVLLYNEFPARKLKE